MLAFTVQEQWQPKPSKIRRLEYSRSVSDGASFDWNVLSKRNLKLISGSCYLPKNSESKPEGEDAHFICEEDRVIGVSDGVGGYSLRGIDSGIYARELMSNSVIAVQHESKGSIDPATVLTEAYSNTKSEGAATACIIALTGQLQQYLHAANIGDSGFVVFREGHNIYCSPTQQHSFNCPYQLGNDRGSDRPASAQIIKVPVKPGDIVVAGTDGLFDNLAEYEIEQAMIKGTEDGLNPLYMASTLAELALYNSQELLGKRDLNTMEGRLTISLLLFHISFRQVPRSMIFDISSVLIRWLKLVIMHICISLLCV